MRDMWKRPEMASPLKSRRSPHYQLRRSPIRTPPRTSVHYSPLRTPPICRTPPLPRPPIHSPLKTPPLFSNISPPPVSHTPPLFSDTSWRTEPLFHYDLRWLNTLSPVATSSPPRLNIMVPSGINPTTVPTTMREMDQFLSSAWNDAYDTACSSEYSRKVTSYYVYGISCECFIRVVVLGVGNYLFLLFSYLSYTGFIQARCGR